MDELLDYLFRLEFRLNSFIDKSPNPVKQRDMIYQSASYHIKSLKIKADIFYDISDSIR